MLKVIIVLALIVFGCQLSRRPQVTLPPGEPMFRQVKAAAISFVPEKLNVEANVEHLEGAFRQAHQQGAELALAPEGIIEGYVVNQVLDGTYTPQQMGEAAITRDGPIMKRFEGLARELNMCLAFGYAERIDGDIYNAAVFIDNKGKVCGRYYKMSLAEGYHPSWWFNRIGKKTGPSRRRLGDADF